MSSKRYHWWQAAAVGLLANAPTALGLTGRNSKPFYQDLDQPPGAPPAWAFGPAWTLNNVTTLWSNLRVANAPEGTPGRRAYLALEGVGWGLFAAFTPAFFGLRSPVLGAVDSVAFFGTTLASTAIATQIDKKAALALLPRLAWTGFASYLALGVARRNDDPLFDG